MIFSIYINIPTKKRGGLNGFIGTHFTKMFSILNLSQLNHHKTLQYYKHLYILRVMYLHSFIIII